MKEKKKFKTMIGLICLIFLLATFCFSSIQSAVFAVSEVTCEFRNGTLNNGSVDYTISGQTIAIELATKDSGIFTKVNITNLQQSIDLNSASYYLKVTDTNNADLVNNGTIINNIPGDGYIMLDANMFNNGQGMFELSAKQQQPGPVGAIKFDFTINGESFTNISVGNQVVVSNSFNMDTINEFYITKIIDGDKTYNYAPNEYSYKMIDNQGRTIFELNYNKVSDNYSNIRIESHSENILDKDIAEGKSKEDYLGFYITNISFVKEAFRGVEVSTAVMPDNYDFTAWNGADLSSSTQSNPGKVSAYYDENIINFSSIVSSKIKNISLVTGSLIPSSAVKINNETGKVTILSNYYNEIPLKIELEDGTIGYITVNRIGIFIGDVNAGVDTFYHGAFAIVGKNLNVDTDKNRIAAVFYHEDTTTYQDYDLIVNITYKDGTTETKIAKGVGDVHNSSGNIVGSDYILWSGNKESEPSKVSVTAVKKGATSSNSVTFSGATFGSGAGVEWKSRQGGNV